MELGALEKIEEYKELILQQREIIINFQQKLRERDELINSQQQELETYEQMLGDAEELLDAKTQRIAQLELYLRKENLSIPGFELRLKAQDKELIDQGEFENFERIL